MAHRHTKRLPPRATGFHYAFKPDWKELEDKAQRHLFCDAENLEVVEHQLGGVTTFTICYKKGKTPNRKKNRDGALDP